jgi:hypothetical protein
MVTARVAPYGTSSGSVIAATGRRWVSRRRCSRSARAASRRRTRRRWRARRRSRSRGTGTSRARGFVAVPRHLASEDALDEGDLPGRELLLPASHPLGGQRLAHERVHGAATLDVDDLVEVEHPVDPCGIEIRESDQILEHCRRVVQEPLVLDLMELVRREPPPPALHRPLRALPHSIAVTTSPCHRIRSGRFKQDAARERTQARSRPTARFASARTRRDRAGVARPSGRGARRALIWVRSPRSP